MSIPEKLVGHTAESAGEETLTAVFDALENQHNFKLEAGAGAGKTFSLIHALKHILERRDKYLRRKDQRIACLTYTKVARDEIIARTDESPFIFADTLHGFLWEMIRPFQKSLRTVLFRFDNWAVELEKENEINELPVDYDLGIRRITDEKISLHHDDIPALAIELFKNPKFRALIADRFPIIFIDEYQDTPAGLAEAMLSGEGMSHGSPILGFFGDHWQQIYDRTCGTIEHSSLMSIEKNANFRSARSIVSLLNSMRPELPQIPAAKAAQGKVTIYHTNDWPGTPLKGHWKGQISHRAAQACLSLLNPELSARDCSHNRKSLKVLMLTHATIANEVGYPTLPTVFRYNAAFINKEDPVIEYLIDVVEPALAAFNERRYGELISVLGGRLPILRSVHDKIDWNNFFHRISSTSKSGTVGEILDLLDSQSLFALPTRVVKREQELKEALESLEPGQELSNPRRLVEHKNLRAVAYREIQALNEYLSNDTVFSTKHAVKGAEFDDVIVVLGRGWSKYDFSKMLATFPNRNAIDEKERASFERSRNLFYVAASRAKHNLSLLFVQQLDENALATLTSWVGKENIESIGFEDENTPLPISQN